MIPEAPLVRNHLLGGLYEVGGKWGGGFPPVSVGAGPDPDSGQECGIAVSVCVCVCESFERRLWIGMV